MNRAYRIIVWAGGIALLGATAIDTVAVIGRNVGLPLHGSIELVQLAVLLAGSVALLLATIAGSHATVHLVMDRLHGSVRDTARRGNTFLTAVFFGLLLAGSGWIAVDLWHAHEVSEIVGIPWRWMRLFANACFAAVIGVMLVQAFGRRRG